MDNIHIGQRILFAADYLQFERRMKRTKGVQTTNLYEQRRLVLAIVTRTWLYELYVKTNFSTELEALRFAAEVVPCQPPPTKPQLSLTLHRPQPVLMTDACVNITDASARTPKVHLLVPRHAQLDLLVQLVFEDLPTHPAYRVCHPMDLPFMLVN